MNEAVPAGPPDPCGPVALAGTKAASAALGHTSTEMTERELPAVGGAGHSFDSSAHFFCLCEQSLGRLTRRPKKLPPAPCAEWNPSPVLRLPVPGSQAKRPPPENSWQRGVSPYYTVS
jgi:hypothetical protein